MLADFQHRTMLMLADHLIAHRGWQRRYPENTAASVMAAIAAGARAVEIDVQLSADGVPVLHHDRSLKRLCGSPGRVADYSWAELATLRASEPGRFGDRFASEPLLRLEDLVARLEDHPQVHLFLEAKDEVLDRFAPAEAIGAMLKAAAPLEGRCTLISFSFPLLRAARRAGWLELGPVLRRWPQISNRAVAGLEPTVVFANQRMLPAGPLATPWPLAIYEIDTRDTATALLARGARWIETFAIGELLGATAPGSEPGSAQRSGADGI